jgi:hypothetical protein
LLVEKLPCPFVTLEAKLPCPLASPAHLRQFYTGSTI